MVAKPPSPSLLKDLPWKEAIIKVLDGSDAPMHYADIAQAIIDNRYRVNDVGATPANTVSANLSAWINKDKSKSPFVKVDRGMYTLRNAKGVPVKKRIEESDEAEETAREMGLINAFGDLLTFPWVWFKRLGRVVVGRGRLE